MKSESMPLREIRKNYSPAVAPSALPLTIAPALCLVLVASTLPGCASPEATASGRDPRPPGWAESSADPRGLTESIRPGVNDRYEGQGSLKTYREIFEEERRDVVVHKAEIIRALPLPRGATVADIGAGTGLFTFDLAERVGGEGRVFAVDVSSTFLDALRSTVRERDPGNVEVHAARPRDLGLPPRSLDLALMSNVYHHVEYPFAYMPTVAEALRDDAELWLIDFERIEGVTSPRMMKHVRAGKSEVIDELERSGFRLVGEAQLGLEENYVLRLVPRRAAQRATSTTIGS